MKKFTGFAILAASVLLSGCAVMDFSTMETAVPLSPKMVRMSVGVANGYDVSGLYYEPGPEELEKDELHGWFMVQGGLAFALNPKSDISFRASYTDGHSKNNDYDYKSLMMKMGVKHLLRQEGIHYTSIVPAVFLIRGEYHDRDANHQPKDFHYSVKGLELQAIHTLQPKEFFAFSIIGRGDYYLIDKIINGQERGPYPAGSFGLRTNIRLSLWNTFLLPEFGFEVLPIRNGKTIVNPITGVGVGLEF